MSDLLQQQRVAAGAAGGGQAWKYQLALTALRRWWLVATPLGLLLSIITGAAIYLTTHPKYTGEAWLIIRDRPDHLLDGTGREDPVRFIANQMEMMRSPPILNPVAAIPAVAQTPEIQREADPVQALKRQVKILRGQSEYFVVQFTSTDPASAALIPNEISKAYLEVQRRAAGLRSDELLELLNHELSQQQIAVERARAAWYEEYTNAVGIAPDVVLDTARTTKLVAESGVEAALMTQLTNAEVESMLVDVNLRYQEAQVPVAPAPSDIEHHVQNDPHLKRLESSLTELEGRIQEYKKLATSAATSQRFQELEQQKTSVAKDLARDREMLRAQVHANLERAAKTQHEADLLRLRAKKTQLERLVASINDKLKSQYAKDDGQKELSKAVGDKMFKVDLLKSDYERAQQRYDLLKTRTEMMGLERRAPSRVEIYEYAKVPTVPDQGPSYKRIGMPAVAALLLPFGLAVGIEFLLRRIGSRDELESGTEISVVGEVTTMPRSANRLVDRNHRPSPEGQLFEECIDGLRTYLTLVRSLQGLRVLAVASSVSGEGKTTLASQLAFSLATAAGARTLLIDGDIRLPDIHTLFEIQLGPGLVDVLRGSIPVEDAIATGYSETLHLLPAGTLRTSPHQLISNGEFARLIDALKEEYRYIVIDTPPILPASEALVMAQTADATVLCVRRDYSRVAQVKAAYFRLQAAGVKTVGAVLNGVPSREYSYHYGSYYYGRSRFQDQSEDPAA